jgi:hypothetical protein
MRARELAQRGHEVPARQPVQVQQRQHLRHLRGLARHGGKIAELNRLRSPVTGSVRLSFTRGAVTSTAPAPVSTVHDCAVPLRTTSRCPSTSRR